MKNIFTCLLIFFSLSISGQEVDIPRKTNQILVYKKDSAINLLKEYARILQDHNFNIEKLDKDLLNIKTEPKSFKFSGVATMKIFANTRQLGDTTVLKITGSIEIINPMVAGPVPFESCNCGIMGNAQLNSFKEILATLAEVKADRVVYLKVKN